MSHQIAAQAQQKAAHPYHSVWVAASAGSGKTKVLTDRVLNLLLEGYTPERILCLTFTKAAAAEMANRLRRCLGEWATLKPETLHQSLEVLRGKPPAPEHIDRARMLFGHILDVPGGLKIQTIHSFCQSLLKRFPLEAGLSPFFEVSTDTQRQVLLKEISYKVLEDVSHQELALFFSEQTLEELHDFILQKRETFKDVRSGLRSSNLKNTHETLVRDLIASIPLDHLKPHLSLFEEGSDSDKERGHLLAQFLTLSKEEKAQKYQTYLNLFLTQKGEKRSCLVTQKVALRSPSLKEMLEQEGDRLERWMERYHEWEIATLSHLFFKYSHAFLDAYEALKKERSLLDYEDLILKASALLRNPGCHWVLYKLDGGLDHILVDEAQDTSFSQWQVIRAIVEEFYANSAIDSRNRTLFIVGDEKQSIYSFQGADPTIFMEMQQDLRTFAKNSGKEWHDVDLTMSFRSTPQVLAVVDAVFSHYPLASQPVIHLPHRKEAGGRVEVWPLLREEKPDDALTPWTPPAAQAHYASPQKRLAYLIAKTIQGWLREGGPLAKPVSPGDVLILVRRRTAFVDMLIRALKEQEVPVAGVDRLWLLESLAVQDLLKIGEFLLLPEDDLTLATVLKGPLCNLSEEDLFKLSYERGTKSLWQRLQKDETFESVKLMLKDLLAQVDFLTPFSLFSHILGPLGGRKKWQACLGPECLDSLDEFLNLCLTYQEENTPSLQGFLYWISQEIIELKRDLDQSDQVRIMTVHGSKGLQAPIVFLPDTTQIPQDLPPFEFDEQQLVWLPPAAKDIPLTKALKQKLRQKQQEEYKRLLYVALTRAEDALYVCGWESKAQDTWYDMVVQAMQGVGEDVDFDFSPHDFFVDKGWRLASEKKEAERRVALAQPTQFLLPSWLKNSPPPEEPLTFLRPSEGGEESGYFEASELGAFGTQRGVLIHKLLEMLCEVEEDARQPLALRFLAQESIDQAVAYEMIEETSRVFKAYPELFSSRSQSEVPIVGKVQGQYLSGQIDRLVQFDDHILCVDFKTHTHVPEKLSDIPQTYIRQMALYQSALAHIFPTSPIFCGLLWTHVPRFDLIPDNFLKKCLPSIDERPGSAYTGKIQA